MKQKKTVAGQVSLSFQLLGADGGLYKFGRTWCLLSTVTGLRIPPHNLIAVHSVKWNPLALFSCVSHANSCLFIYFLVVDVFKQVIHPTRENTLGYSVRVSQVLFGFCPGKTQTSQDWRWAMSRIFPVVNLNQDYAGVSDIGSVLGGHYVCFLLATERSAGPAVPSWNYTLHGETAQPPRTAPTRKTVKTNVQSIQKKFTVNNNSAFCQSWPDHLSSSRGQLVRPSQPPI